jgi:glucose-1-phosphate adenylyltransferase
MMGADFYETREQLQENVRENIPNIGIGEHTTIAGAIIDKNARIGNHVSIGNSGKCSDWDGENFYLRDHIVVIPGGAVIPDGTVIGKDGK